VHRYRQELLWWRTYLQASGATDRVQR
jgi:hypothetical protein